MTPTHPRLHLGILIVLAWLAVIGLDFLLNAGIFATVFAEDWEFLLSPQDLFRRIPLGYGAFLVLAILVAWVLGRSAGAAPMNALAGVRVGVRVGLFVGAAGALGLASISPAPMGILVAWFFSYFLGAGVAGTVLGAGMGGMRIRALAPRVGGFFVACVAVAIGIQNLG
ncbi:MAG: hypothetical protein HOB82_07275 [Alphaproteobacteria bacterium]|nr:hypothetical protein [Alphaproteobacteria bacterium]